MTLWGRLVSAPSLVIEIEEVFEARITSGRASRSRSRKISALISNFSVAASTMKSQSASLARSVTASIFFNADALSSAEILFFATSRSRFFEMVAIPRSKNRCSTSHRITEKPLRAKTWAIPLPMVPAPTTPTSLISMNPPLARENVTSPEGCRVLETFESNTQLGQTEFKGRPVILRPAFFAGRRTYALRRLRPQDSQQHRRLKFAHRSTTIRGSNPSALRGVNCQGRLGLEG